jgi:amidase/aspartyl-tRNA(Asn)/glutamyl-tRNA(Gln) amidotransferase subunit A
MGLLTQPISCIGLPVCCVPVWTPGNALPGTNGALPGTNGALPVGVQLIAAPWREDIVLRAAAALEAAGVVAAPVAALNAWS